MIKNNPSEFQPQDDRFWKIYRGVVEDNNDPEKMGRCRIRIFGIHTQIKEQNEIEGIPTDHLPWAEPALSLFEGSVSGFGGWNVPLQGSHVFLFFEDGHPLRPIFFASVPGKPTDQNHGYKEEEGFSDPESNYPVENTEFPHKPNGLDESDWHRLARNEDTIGTIVKYKNDNTDKGVSIAGGGTWDEPDSYYSAEYPDNKVYATRSGITVEIDDTNGEERIHIYHPSKSYIEINKDGSIVIRNAKDRFDIIDSNKKEHVMSNSDTTIDGSRTEKVGTSRNTDIGTDETKTVGSNQSVDISGDETKTVGGSNTIEIGGTEDKTITGGWNVSSPSAITITSSTSITIAAPSVSVTS